MFGVKRKLADKRVILASRSPRRKELLGMIADDFEVCPAYGDEIIPVGVTTFFVTVFLAEQKCTEVVERLKPDENTVVIACDTAVICDNKIFGKPKNKKDASDMLHALSGKQHFVSSGLCVYYKGKYHKRMESASVTFADLTDEDIKDYIATGEPMDKAGSYAIQGLGGLLVKKIVGDYYTIVGLPVYSLCQLLDDIL